MAITTKRVTLGLFVLLGGTWLGCNPQATDPKDDPVCVQEHKARGKQTEGKKKEIETAQKQCEAKAAKEADATKRRIEAEKDQCEAANASNPTAKEQCKKAAKDETKRAAEYCDTQSKEATARMEWDEVCLSVECGLRVSTNEGLKKAASSHLRTCRENGFLVQKGGDSNADAYMAFVLKCLGDDALKTADEKSACMFAVLTKLTAQAHPPKK